MKEPNYRQLSIELINFLKNVDVRFEEITVDIPYSLFPEDVIDDSITSFEQFENLFKDQFERYKDILSKYFYTLKKDDRIIFLMRMKEIIEVHKTYFSSEKEINIPKKTSANIKKEYKEIITLIPQLYRQILDYFDQELSYEDGLMKKEYVRNQDYNFTWVRDPRIFFSLFHALHKKGYIAGDATNYAKFLKSILFVGKQSSPESEYSYDSFIANINADSNYMNSSKSQKLINKIFVFLEDLEKP